MNLQIGSSIGDYQIVGILGAGGMGKVYKVRNVISDRIEAMKVLLPDLATEHELADRFLREIKTQASLEHPNIAGLHTALRIDNQLLMFMEFVEGLTLEQKLKNDGPLPVAEAVDYISQALSALEYAHKHGVIHRDIKPANMMLTPGGRIKLMDFGIAKGAGDQRLTMTGTTMGSLYYMSPEQIQGAAHIDSRADLYSLGVSLYELVTGKRPFDGDSQFAIMSAHLEKTPVPPVELDPRLPQPLNDAILMSVAKDPATRFQTAAAFRSALSSVIPAASEAPVAAAAAPTPAAGPLQAPPPIPAPTQAIGASAAAAFQPQPVAPAAAPVPMASAPPKSKRGLWMAVGALAAALGAIAVIQFAPWKNTKAQAPPQQAQQSQPAPQQTAPPQASQAAQTPAPEITAPTQAAPQTTAQAPAPEMAAGAAKQKSPAKSTPMQTASVRPSQIPSPRSNAPGDEPQQHAMAQAPIQQQAQQPVPQQVQQPAQQAAPQQPAGPSRAEMSAARERYAQLEARASGIRGTLQTMQRSMASSGLNLSSKFTQPQSLMDSYMRGASDAIQASDPDSAKDLMNKAERQIEVLEKLLNR